MAEVIEAPRGMVQSVAELHLPAKSDQRLQRLMDRNNEGKLTPDEREELAALAELSETISLVRSQALRLLAKQ